MTMAAVVLFTMLGIRAAGYGPGRWQPPAPTDLTTALAGTECLSTEEALRRWEEAARGSNPSSRKETL